MSAAIELVIDLPFLAGEINDAQRQMDEAKARIAELEVQLAVYIRIEEEALAEFGPVAGREIGRLRCRLEELGDDWRTASR